MKLRKRTSDTDNTDTLIGEATVVEGKITCQAGLRIEGKVYGDIECQGDVTVGRSGHAVSNISARNVVAAGFIQGSIAASDLLTITETGKVDGNIHVGAIIISQGGVFHGSSHMELPADNKHGRPDKKSKHDDSHKPQLSKVEKLASSGR